MAERLRLVVRGAVPGVDVRPLVERLAHDHQLRVSVRNSSRGVVIDAEGERAHFDEFRLALERDGLARAVRAIEEASLDGTDHAEVAVHDEHAAASHPSADVWPDRALCESCRGELLDPNNRRYRYPFINCANCGPRYSIIERLPYERSNTSMRDFVMCHACEREYHDPLDRRFHAAPNACPACGPQVALWDVTGAVVATRDAAVIAAANAIRAGKIVAVKGVGGFQLLVDATDDAAVRRLRDRTRHHGKPYSIMCPDIECVQQHATLGPDEARLLASPEAPIVLVTVRASAATELAPAVASGSRQLGVMLPYTPLHVLLMRDLRRAIVVTSGNHPGEPVCIDEGDVVARLGDTADLFLVHNQPILRRVVATAVARVDSGSDPLRIT